MKLHVFEPCKAPELFL